MAVTLDVADVLSAKGMSLKVDNTDISWAYDLADLGGDPNMQDCTPITSEVALKKDGIIDMDAWEVKYYYNEDDWAIFAAALAAKTSKTVTVEMPNGDKFTNSGVCIANRLEGFKSGDMNSCVAKFSFNNDWTRTPHS